MDACPLEVVEPLLGQPCVDPRAEDHGVERLREVVVGAGLDAADDALGLVDCGDHDHRHVLRARCRLEPLEHRDAVELGHDDVEQHDVDSRSSANSSSASAPFAAARTSWPSCSSRRRSSFRLTPSSSAMRIVARHRPVRILAARRPRGSTPVAAWKDQDDAVGSDEMARTAERTGHRRARPSCARAWATIRNSSPS